MIRNDRIINSLIRDDMVEKLIKEHNIGITEARERISEMSFSEYRSIDEASADIVPPSGQPIAPGATQSGTPQTTKPSATTQPTTTTPPNQGTADPRGVQVRNPVTGKMEWMQPTNAMAGKQGAPAPGAQQVAENDTPTESVKYEVVDRQTGKVVGGPYSTLSRARAVVDKKDNAYGAYRYTARRIKQVSENIDLARMKHLAGIVEDGSSGGTCSGAIATAPAAMGSMKKRQYTAEQPKEYTPKEAPKTIIGDTKPAQASGELSANLAAKGKKTASRTNNGFKK